MTWCKGRPLGLCAVLAIGSADADRFLERFSELSKSSAQEESYVTDLLARGRKETIAKPVPHAPKYSQDFLSRLGADQRVEWGLRSPELSAGYGFDLLAQVKQVELLDAGLWAYFRQGVPDIFADSVRWPFEKERFAKFLKKLSFEQRKSLFEQEHGDWWRWFANEEIAQIQDPLVLALNSALNAVLAKGNPRIHSLVEARSFLFDRPGMSEELSRFDKRATELLGREYPNGIEANQALFAFDTKDFKAQKRELMRTLVEYWKARRRPEFGADALAKYHVLNQSFEVIDGRQSLEVAKLHLDGRRFLEAVNSFEKAIVEANTAIADLAKPIPNQNFGVNVQRSDAGVLRTVINDATAGLAFATEQWAEAESGPEQKNLREWAAERFRSACEKSLQSKHRDALLEGYSRTLERLGYAEAAIDVSEALFKLGMRRESQVRGLKQMSRILYGQVSDYLQDRSPDMYVRKQYMRLIATMNLLSKSEPRYGELRTYLVHAKAWMPKLDMTNDALLTATLGEIQGRVGPL